MEALFVAPGQLLPTPIILSRCSQVIQEPLPLKQKIPLCRRFAKTILRAENPEKNKEKSISVKPFLRFTKTTDVFLKFAVLRAGGS